MTSLGRMWRHATSASIAAILFMVATPVAHAVIYVGSWEPPYGTPFLAGVAGNGDTLFWTGKAKFDVPNNCGITNETGTFGNTCGAQVLSAQVNFSAASDPNNILQSIFWNSGGPNLPGAINNLMFVDGKLEQVNSGLFAYVSPSPFDPRFGGSSPPYSVVFALQFFIDLELGVEQFRSGPFLHWRQADCAGESCPGGLNDALLYEPQFTITVPEPTAVTLLAGALLAAGVARRRRSLGVSDKQARSS